MSLEERLRRIEALLERVLERLDRLEGLTGTLSLEARLALEIAQAFTLHAQESVAAARRAARALARLGGHGLGDAVTQAIVEALAARGPLSLRGLEREVRRLRGTASRSVIAERLRRLEEAGVVRVERRGRRMVISLEDEEDENDGGNA